MYLKQKDNFFSFLELILNEDYKALNQLISQHQIDLNLYPENHKPILQYLNKFKSTEMVHFLVDNGANVNLKCQAGFYNKQETSPLILACSTYKPQMLKALLECGANPNITDTFNQHALFYCLFNSQGNDLHKKDVLDCVDILLNTHIDLTRKNQDYNQTILNFLEARDQHEIAQHIIQKIGSEKANQILTLPSELGFYVEFIKAQEEKEQIEKNLNVIKSETKKIKI